MQAITPAEPVPVEPIAVDHRGAAKLISVSERHLSNLVARGLIRRAKLGQKNLYLVEELRRSMRENLI